MLIVVIAPQAYISSKKDQWKKNRIVKQFKLQTDSAFNDLNVDLYDFYKHHGLDALREMKKTLGDDNRFQNFVREACAHPLETESVADSKFLASWSDVISLNPAFALKSMMKLGLISKVGEAYTRNEERIKAMNEFLRFVVQQQRRNKHT